MPVDNLSEDLFADSRMTFGEHIEELRTHLLRAFKWLLYCLVVGFALDAVGYAVDKPWIGVGRPMMGIITAPVRDQLRLFYDRRLERLLTNRDRGEAGAVEVTRKQPVNVLISPEDLAKIRGVAELPADPVEVVLELDPVGVFSTQRRVQDQVRPPELTTLSVQESMVVYIKVCLLSSLILASPLVFWEIWSFVAAGLYPHEKHYVHKYLPMSLGLFIAGVFLCQFAVIPQSIGALLWFNDWLGFTPDLRLNEWLSFALLLPLVFGISFQTPIVMMFMARIGVMSVEKYLAGWKVAVFILAVFAAVITPTPDAYTMLLMWLPLCGLYFLGIYLCKVTGSVKESIEESEEDAVLDEVQ